MMEKKLLKLQLKKLGSELENPPTSKDPLLELLNQVATCLSELDQSPSLSMLNSVKPLINAIAMPELLNHQDMDIKLLVTTCVCEIIRITAPKAPFSDEILKEIFHLIVGTFGGLIETSSPSFERRVVILETLARYRSCVVMLDLECYDLINEMFRTLFAVVSAEHPENVLTSVQTIMIVLLEESEDIREDLLLVILSNLTLYKNDTTMAARKLAMNVIEQCAGQLEPCIQKFLISSVSGEGKSLDNHVNYHEVIYEIYVFAPQILLGVIPYITGELLTDHLDTRLKAVKLAGNLFSLPGSAISEAFQPFFSEFLKRLTDCEIEVRKSVLEQIKRCLLSSPPSVEAPRIICALCDCLLDCDEINREQTVGVIYDAACHSIESGQAETAKLVAEHLQDKSILAETFTMERLADMYRLYCLKWSDDVNNPNEFDWIPGRILRCTYDKDFRSDVIESVLSGSIFPAEVSNQDKVKHWVRLFSSFGKLEIKALENLMEQKQRLQQELQKYLALKQMSQGADAPEVEKKILACFRIMSRWFPDSLKAEEQFQILDQFKDANILKILSSLLDPSTGSQQASTHRDDLLKIVGEKHQLYEFLSALSMKCSYLLFNKEHVRELLHEAAVQKSAGNGSYISSCMDILVILASYSPSLLAGIEEDLVNLLKDDNEIIKEGVLHVLAKAGGTIREQLDVLSSPVDLTLERLCLEGSRKQAKYAVHALAAITMDDGLKSLSVLYKRLVDMLEENTNLPTVLQSLGCIAQTAMPVFETREKEIEDCIHKILECNTNAKDNVKACWDDRSEACSLKIFGIKTLVKSYLPVKDAQLRLGIDRLFHILKNILLHGEISKDIESSSTDKAHLKLASANSILRLSRHWDHKIPVDIFFLTLKTSEDNFPLVKKLFLSKIHHYIKDRVLDAKFACAFLINIIGSKTPEFEDVKQILDDIIQMCHQAKALQLSQQNEANSFMVYPEFILPYLVHTLAHHSCPDIDECKDFQAFEDIYRLLHLFLTMLVRGDGNAKSEGGISGGGISGEKERFATITSIFHSIKQSDDVFDVNKSKNSHVICDLGMSIVKRLAKPAIDIPELISPISLPSIIYRLHEKKAEDDSKINEGQTWLAGESIVAHFESLTIDTNGDLEILDDGGQRDTDRVLSKGKTSKPVKSKRTKSKKVMKKNSPSMEVIPGESDVDIMKMVRELDLENVGVSSRFESSNGHGHAPWNFEKAQLKKETANASELDYFSVPKRRRSSSNQNSPKVSLAWSSSKLRTSALYDDSNQTGLDSEPPCGSEKKKSKHKDIDGHEESDLLVSRLRKSKSPLLKRGGRGKSDKGYGGKVHENSESDKHDLKKSAMLVEIDKVNTKKRKRIVAGLTKCSLKEAGIHTKELIGCKIKVWWPMDKKFYEGLVKSYDPQQKRHKVLYDDGDMEVLHLDKERWELIAGDRKSKKLNLPKSRKSVEDSPEMEDSGGSKRKRKLVRIAKGKRTPKKKMKHRHEALNFKEAESRENSDMSDVEPTTTSKPQDVNTSDHGNAQNVEKGDEVPTDMKESDSNAQNVEKVDEVPTDMKESDSKMLKESDGNAQNVEKVDEVPMDTKESDSKMQSVSEGKPVEDANSPSHVVDSNKDEKLDSVEDISEPVFQGEKVKDENISNHKEETDEKEVSDGMDINNMENIVHEDTQESNKEGKDHLREKEVEASRLDTEEASKDQISVSDLDHKTDDPQSSTTISNNSEEDT